MRVESPRGRRWLLWLAFGLILLFEGSVRWRLLDFPLERDEGEYTYNAQLLLQGVSPYEAAIASHKLPGMYLVCAPALAFWPDLPGGLHITLLIANAASTACLFVLMRKLAGDFAALASAMAFALLAIGEGVLGFAAHSEHFVVTPTLVALLLLLGALERPAALVRLFAAGFALGIAIVIRQPAALFALLALALLIASDRSKRKSLASIVRRSASLSVGVVLPFALVCILMWSAGVFPTFWFWTVEYASEYGSRLTFARGLVALFDTLPRVVSTQAPIWIAALLGLALSIGERTRRTALVVGWTCVASAAVAAGFHFREHYFVQLLPVVAALFGIACAGPTWLSARAARTWRWVAIVAATSILTGCVWSQRDYLFRTPVLELCRRIYAGNLFVEVQAVAIELRERSSESDTIAVLGSEAELCAYAHRRSASKYIYTYALTESSPFAEPAQRAMISEIETARPRFFVFVNSVLSWMPNRDSPQRIFEWSKQFVEDGYELVGVVEAEGTPRWDDEARAQPPTESRPYVAVYGRR